MWEPRRFRTLWTFMACYRDSLTFYTLLLSWLNSWSPHTSNILPHYTSIPIFPRYLMKGTNLFSYVKMNTADLSSVYNATISSTEQSPPGELGNNSPNLQFLEIYDARSFIAVFIRAQYLTVYCTRWVQSISLNHISLFPSGFPFEILNAFIISLTVLHNLSPNLPWFHRQILFIEEWRRYMRSATETTSINI
jgi:hypothetical protein